METKLRPDSLVCGMLEDSSGRVLFLEKKRTANDKDARIELPCVLVADANANPVQLISDAFRKQTGIDGEVCDIAFEARHNAGSRKNRNWVACLVFRMKAKSFAVHPSSEFAGFRWMRLQDSRNCRLSRNCEWLSRI